MFHEVVRAKDGIFVFGMIDFGQLGLGDTQNRETPQRLKFFDNHEILSIHSGDFHVLVYTTDGLFGFGSNRAPLWRIRIG